MSRDPRPFGSDTLTIPVYLAKGNGMDDPGLQRWKRDHPDWFAAGHWSAGSRVPERGAARGDEAASRGHHASYDPRVLSAQALLDSIRPENLDPTTLSVADFLQAAAQANEETARSSSRAPDRSERLPGRHSGPDQVAAERIAGTSDDYRSVPHAADASATNATAAFGTEPPPITADQLRAIMPGAGDAADRYVEPLNRAMAAHGINTPERRAAFLAQVSVESGQLNDAVENLNYSAQQMTEVWPRRFPTPAAAAAYANNPEALQEPQNAANTAAKHWQDNGLNGQTERILDRARFDSVSRAANLPEPNSQARWDAYVRALEALNAGR